MHNESNVTKDDLLEFEKKFNADVKEAKKNGIKLPEASKKPEPMKRPIEFFETSDNLDTVCHELAKIEVEALRKSEALPCRERAKELGIDKKIFEQTLKKHIKEVEASRKNEYKAFLDELDLIRTDDGRMYLLPPGYKMNGGTLLHYPPSRGKSFPEPKELYEGIFIVDGIIQNIDDGLYKTEIVYTSKNGNIERRTVDSSQLRKKQKFLELTDYGLKSHEGLASEHITYLHQFEEFNSGEIPLKKSVSNLGWRNEFKDFVPYSKNIVCDSADKNKKKYRGAVSQEGDSERSYKLIIDLINHHQVNYLMVIVSFSSLLLKLLGCKTFICHLYGESAETGKSRLFDTLASIWGNPEELIDTFNSSIPGKRESISFLNNLPYYLDELESVPEKEMPMMLSNLYELTEGTPKSQAKQNGDAKDNFKFWNNVILTNGEHDLTPSNAKKGMLNRVFDVKMELGDRLLFPRTEPEEGARVNPIDGKPIKHGDVERIAKNNYGFVGRDFIEYLQSKFNNPKDNYKEKLINEYDHLQVKLSNYYTGRQSDIGATILVTAGCFVAFMQHKGYNLHGLDPQMVYKSLKTRDDVDTDKRSLNLLLQTVEAEKKHFKVYDEGNYVSGEELAPMYGIIEDSNIFLLGKYYDQLMTDNGYYNNKQTLLDWLDKRKLLVRKPKEKKRKRFRGSVKGINGTWVCISKKAYDKC